MSPAPETPAETLLSVVKLDAQGLVPVIAQEIETGMVACSPGRTARRWS